jgi:hypothetical protein
VPRQREKRVVGSHPAPVVRDLDPGDSPLLDVDRHPRRARVEGVLDELLHDRRGPLDDLAGGDLVHEDVGENANRRHGAAC